MFTKTVILFISLLVISDKSDAKLKVRVLYESECPGCRVYVSSELGPTTEKLSSYLDVHLVPYGFTKATEKNGKLQFKCQHGEQECLGNKIQACSIEAIGNKTKSILFVACMMGDVTDPTQALHSCGSKMKIATDQIEKCANSEHGSILLKKYGDETNAVNPEYVPYIEVNGSNKDEDELRNNFFTEICKLIGEPVPEPCKNPPHSIKSSMSPNLKCFKPHN